MEKDILRERLDEVLDDMPWTYSLNPEEKIIQFKNIKTGLLDEKKFLENLKEEGSNQIIDGNGDLSYKISNIGGSLQLSLIRGDSMIGEGKEIEEREALRVFRKSKSSERSGVFDDFFDLFRGRVNQLSKEFAPNKVKLGFDQIENLQMSEDTEVKSLNIIGKDFIIELRGDGGCSIFSR